MFTIWETKVSFKAAIYEFLDDFVPHMEEEENTFLPLLCKYFDYDELKQIKVDTKKYLKIIFVSAPLTSFLEIYILSKRSA